MAGYDRKSVEISHAADKAIRFTLEVNVAANGNWLPYATINVPPGQKLTHLFPTGYAAHWIRIVADRDCKATAQFTYE